MASRYLISFLGDDSKYDVYEYSRADDTNNTCKMKYAPVAAMVLYAIEKAYVVCPTAVAKDSFNRMIAQLPNTISKDNIFDAGFGTDINSTTVGMYKSLLYDLIESIVSDTQNRGVEWIFDISLGFRSLPFEAASIIAYLSIVQPDVRVVDTIYTQIIKQSVYQFQSLTRQTTYNAWTRATDMFIRYGQADLFSKQLKILKQEQSNLEPLIAELDKNFTGVADALHTANTRLLGQCAANLQRNIGDIKQQSKDSGPLFTLLDRVAGEYAVFIPENNSYQAEIVRQRQVIQWYLDKRNWALAIQLAAEHLILLKLIADKKIANICDAYSVRNFAGKVWYGWVFTNESDEFVDVEPTYNRLIAAQVKYDMQPFQIWDDNIITYKYWEDFQNRQLGDAEQQAIEELLHVVGNRIVFSCLISSMQKLWKKSKKLAGSMRQQFVTLHGPNGMSMNPVIS